MDTNESISLSNAESELESSPLDSKLRGTYQFVADIGSGGMGSVIKARHMVLQQYVAIKTIKTDKLGDTSAINRFILEAKAASKLKHENLVGLREFGVDSEGNPFAVMDFADGVVLDKLIDKSKGMANIDQILGIAIGAARGLAHAHGQGITHRDIKPSNIIITKDSSGKDLPVIVDFGIAKLNSEDGQRLTQTGEVFGSPYYVSPEQGLGQNVDLRTDIYSLGCVIFECIVGTPPFQGENPMQTVMKHVHNEPPTPSKASKRKLPAGLDQIVLTCLNKKPEQRYQTAQELATALEAVRVGRAPKVVRPRKKSAWAVVLITISLCGLLFLAALKFIAPTAMIIPGSSLTANLPISDFAKTAVDQDMGRSYQLFQQGDYNNCAFVMRNSTTILKEEMVKLKKNYENAKSRAERKKWSNGMYYLQWLIDENVVHTGQCFLKLKDYAQAAPYYEEVIGRMKDCGLQGRDHPLVHETYQGYIEILRGMKDDKKLSQIEADYKEVQDMIKGARG